VLSSKFIGQHLLSAKMGRMAVMANLVTSLSLFNALGFKSETSFSGFLCCVLMQTCFDPDMAKYTIDRTFRKAGG
jgi:hypothetical protein